MGRDTNTVQMTNFNGNDLIDIKRYNSAAATLLTIYETIEPTKEIKCCNRLKKSG